MARRLPAVGNDDTLERLVHPVYLDVPMLVSFLAALEGGVRFEDHVTVRETDSTGKDKDAKVRVGLPAVLSLLNLSATGRIGEARTEESGEEVTMIRRHTEASLLNVLLSRLRDRGMVRELKGNDELPDVSPGDFVEFSGEILENPLHRLLVLLARMAPIIGLDLEQLARKGPNKSAQSSKKGQGTQSSQVDSDAAEGIRYLLLFGGEMLDSAVQDLVLRGDDGLEAVLTLATEHITFGTFEHLLQSRFSVVGKTTRVVQDGDSPINLTRRTSLSVLPQEQVDELFSGAEAAMQEDLSVDLGSPLIEGPAIQVMPLAIFV